MDAPNFDETFENYFHDDIRVKAEIEMDIPIDVIRRIFR